MKFIKTYELFGFLKKKRPEKEFDIDLLKQLLYSDLDGVKWTQLSKNIHRESESEVRIRDLSTIVDELLDWCRFKPDSKGHPKLHSTDWFANFVYCSKTGYRDGPRGVWLNTRNSQTVKDLKLDIREFYQFMNIILKNLNKERMEEYGIGFCPNEHSQPFDSILFYNL